MSEDGGHYEQVGDVAEWVWDAGKAPEVKVPKGEFSPLDPEPEPEPKPKKAAAKK